MDIPLNRVLLHARRITCGALLSDGVKNLLIRSKQSEDRKQPLESKRVNGSEWFVFRGNRVVIETITQTLIQVGALCIAIIRSEVLASTLRSYTNRSWQSVLDKNQVSSPTRLLWARNHGESRVRWRWFNRIVRTRPLSGCEPMWRKPPAVLSGRILNPGIDWKWHATQAKELQNPPTGSSESDTYRNCPVTIQSKAGSWQIHRRSSLARCWLLTSHIVSWINLC